MLTHIQNIKWVGALSLEDADVLANMSKDKTKILEFGPGGSTMIFSQCINREGSVVSVETRPAWIPEIQSRLDLIEEKSSVDLVLYDDFFQSNIEQETYDLIFVDGERTLREAFASKTWKLLKSDGQMVFHDTKRTPYINHCLFTITKRYLEVDAVYFNVKASNGVNSNMSVIKKIRKVEPVNDLQSLEQKREKWTFGDFAKDQYTIEKGLYQYKIE
jgi:predicted O-methyltransferase YrrM